MKTTFASDYTRKIAYEEYPLEIYCHGHFEVKACDYYSQDCPNSCSFAKAKEIVADISKSKSCEGEVNSSKVDTLNSFSSLHSFRNGLERFIQKWGEKWKK